MIGDWIQRNRATAEWAGRNDLLIRRGVQNEERVRERVSEIHLIQQRIVDG